ncbi:MAG TPA: hypothetical protein VHE35_37090 [Kofleriaceae bacterium]|nr:hypothetical protein [Kofleriaceae bacterium]
MDISGSDPVGAQYAVSVEKLRQSSQKAQGEAAVKLIEQSQPTVGPDGEGTHIDTYA